MEVGMAFADIAVSGAVVEVIAQAWGRRFSGEAVRLYGGEESAAYRLGDAVVRIGPDWRSTEEAEWCHEVAVHAGARIVEVVRPLLTRSGGTVVRVEGHPVSLWPYAQGRWLDREDAGECTKAAQFLARLHRALAGATVPERPCPSFLETGLRGEAPVEPIELSDLALDGWLAEFHHSTRVRHPLHGDFYRGNLLTEDGRITAVLDWDYALVGPPEFEVAYAAREFGSRWGADLGPARQFVADYSAAGGTAETLDDMTLVQLIRHRLRSEAAHFVLNRNRRAAASPGAEAYHQRQVELFWKLRP